MQVQQKRAAKSGSDPFENMLDHQMIGFMVLLDPVKHMLILPLLPPEIASTVQTAWHNAQTTPDLPADSWCLCRVHTDDHVRIDFRATAIEVNPRPRLSGNDRRKSGSNG